ncbi:hypothetical protein MIND_00293800 [Mycena indigotica]|uniref:Uncharacterized protein n=1 Tax=Mycena indigotica TaxID=2126181 RepID=A0A8H6T4F0_9AGAR|nr:uncharacterized protein MIND_00293800 [Mycena indigotica]KAF7309235.1 hypothetical protein MIND_00293800 [Mycena indigotica]
MRYFTTAFTLALCLTLANTVPIRRVAPLRRALDPTVNCPDKDDNGSPLLASGVADEGQFSSCTYEDAKQCQYFAADGSFSSGASTCPDGLPQNLEVFNKGGAAKTEETKTTTVTERITVVVTKTIAIVVPTPVRD